MSALAWRPAGLVVAGRHRSPAGRELLASLPVPLVEIRNLGDHSQRQRKADPLKVGFDHYRAERYSGQVGYVGIRSQSFTLGAERLAGFCDVFRERSSSEA